MLMTNEVADAAVQQAEAVWDNFDADMARNVAWLSIAPVAATAELDLPSGHSLTSFLHSEIRDRRLRSNGGDKCDDLVGCAIVCGDMAAERHFFELKSFVSFADVDGYDISQESLNRAQLNGVEFTPCKADCNQISLPEDRYDLIVGHQGIHHIAKIPHLFNELEKSLKPDGLLFLSEWVGPRYLQIPWQNHLISVILLYLFFPKHIRTTHMGKTKGFKFLQYGPGDFDPSEACNSDEIEPELLKRFEYVKSAHFGGLCYPMFEGNAQNLLKAFPKYRRRVGFVIELENWLTKLGLIKPLFLNAICQPKSAQQARSSGNSFLNN